MFGARMIMRIGLAIVCCLLSVGALAASDPPTPSAAEKPGPPKKQATQVQQKPTPDKTSAPSTPIIFYTNNQAREGGDNEKKNDEGSVPEQRMAWFTLGLLIVAFLQAGLFVWQLIFIQRTVALARQEFNATHRPKVILRDATSEQDDGERIVVKYILANVGDAPATIVGSALAVRVFKGFESGPDNLPAIVEGQGAVSRITIKPGAQSDVLSFMSPTERWIGDARNTFNDPDFGLFFSGQIIYEGADGTQRSAGFRRKYFSNQHRYLRADNGEHYEY